MSLRLVTIASIHRRFIISFFMIARRKHPNGSLIKSFFSMNFCHCFFVNDFQSYSKISIIASRTSLHLKKTFKKWNEKTVTQFGIRSRWQKWKKWTTLLFCWCLVVFRLQRPKQDQTSFEIEFGPIGFANQNRTGLG